MKIIIPINFTKVSISILLIILSCCSSPVAQENFSMKKGIIYIVRHAEKDTGNNPGLTAEGHARSGYLAAAFNKCKMKVCFPERIYVTQFRRTQLTADSIRLRSENDTVHYQADNTGDDLIRMLKKHIEDNNILIIAHSNTIPAIINRLGIKNYQLNIADNEYDKLFMITYRKRKATLYNRKFGNPSDAGSNSGWEKVL